jgi:hypothetical protein
VFKVEAKLVEQFFEPKERANSFVQRLFVCEVIGHGRLVFFNVRIVA